MEIFRDPVKRRKALTYAGAAAGGGALTGVGVYAWTHRKKGKVSNEVSVTEINSAIRAIRAWDPSKISAQGVRQVRVRADAWGTATVELLHAAQKTIRNKILALLPLGVLGAAAAESWFFWTVKLRLRITTIKEAQQALQEAEATTNAATSGEGYIRRVRPHILALVEAVEAGRVAHDDWKDDWVYGLLEWMLPLVKKVAEAAQAFLDAVVDLGKMAFALAKSMLTFATWFPWLLVGSATAVGGVWVYRQVKGDAAGAQRIEQGAQRAGARARGYAQAVGRRAREAWAQRKPTARPGEQAALF